MTNVTFTIPGGLVMGLADTVMVYVQARRIHKLAGPFLWDQPRRAESAESRPPPPVAQAQYSRFFRYQNVDGPYVAALTPLVTYVGSDNQMGVTPGTILCMCACRIILMRRVSRLAFDFKAASTTVRVLVPLHYHA